jgi:agmatinase
MKELGIKKNFLAIDKKFSTYKTSEIVIVSAPFEKTVSYGKGTKNGPKEILEASHYVEFYDEELERELCFEKGICTLEPLEISKLSPKAALSKINKQVGKVLEDNKFVVTLGGEHSISSAPIRAFTEKYGNISILHFDAHSDLRQSYEGSEYSHASVMARVFEFNRKLVQVGIRAQCIEEAQFIKENEISTFYARAIRTGAFAKGWQQEVLSRLGKTVYISFDIDCFDPSIVSATGTPEPGGLFWDETMDLLKLVGAKRDVVGFDVVELAPEKSKPESNYIAAKLVYKILNYAFQNK